MRRALIPLAAALVAAGAAPIVAGTAAAQVLAGPAPGGEPSSWDATIAWVMAEQRAFHEQLTAALRSLAEDGGGPAAWALIAASFLYGIFHAAGPGHGKAVLATYLLTSRQRLRRGMVLAAASALCQAVSAIALVYGLIFAAGWLPRETARAVDWSERASFVLVMLMGAWLVARAGRAALPLIRRRTAGHHGADHACHHGCVHAAHPGALEAEGERGVGSATVLVLSIGLRPCTGAVLVLVFAHVAGIAWAGVAAVAAMAAGTAVAVAALAFITVNLRAWASALAVRRPGRWWPTVGHLATIAGGALLIAIGVSLLIASFAPPHPLGL